MPSNPLPSSADDYAAPEGMLLDKASWDAAITDMAARIRACEAIRASFQTLIDAGTGQALEIIQANVGPQLALLESNLTTLQSQLSFAVAQVEALFAGNLPAANVTFTPGTSGLSSTNAQTAITELKTDVDANTAAIGNAANIGLVLALGG